jgi:glutathione S-transferase
VIDLYTWSTPNGRKASIALEEMGFQYAVHPIDIFKNEQFGPDFLRISPNNRIPAIVDRDTGMALMESGAILIYLAEKSRRYLPSGRESRMRLTILFTFVLMHQNTRASAIKRKHRGCTAYWTAGLQSTSMLPMSTRLPTWRFGLGCRVTNGRQSI